MAEQTVAGSTVHIGTENADLSKDTIAEYDGDTFTKVGEVEDIGEFGDAWTTTEWTDIEGARVRRHKVAVDGGEVTLVVAYDPGDAGQTAIATAHASKSDFTFKVELDDKSSGMGATNTTFYFSGKVLNNRLAMGRVENVIRRNITIAVNTDVLEKAAT